jgi:TorA maturation chaperone TorD
MSRVIRAGGSTDEALARAVVYRALSIAFQAPSEARLDRIGARRGFPVLKSALNVLGLPPIAVQPDEAADATYWRLFGHTTRGPICACETEYGPDNGFHQPQQLADINGYYLAFGLQPGAASDLRADHIACECEFMDFLCRKEALLTSTATEPPAAETLETLETTRQAERTFLRDHLGRFGRAFGTRVAAQDPNGYLGAIGRTLALFLDGECQRAGVQAGSVDLAVRPEDVDPAPIACGSGTDELIQIQRRP